MPHVLELDGLRAIAIGIVFLGHTDILRAFPGGFGVTIFFFLSGYLITTLLRIEHARTGTISLRNFYVRRFLRINPSLWISMAAIGAILALGLGDLSLDPLVLASQAFFFSNYLPTFGHDGGLPMPLWSLAVEEHFYLLFPLCFLLAMRRLNATQIAALCAVACTAVLGIRMFNIHALGIVESNYYWTHTRIDSILFGCILALWQNPVVETGTAWRPRAWHVGLALAAITVTFVLRDTAFREGPRYSIQGAALFVLFSFVLHDKGWLSKLLRLPILQRVGLYSYTIYLIHYAMIYAVRTEMPGQSKLVQAAAAAMLSFAYAAAMYRLVEKPTATLRRRLNPVEEQSDAHSKLHGATGTGISGVIMGAQDTETASR